MYVDALMNRGTAMDWGITGVGVLPQDRRMHEVMGAQDCLYTLVVKHPDGTLEPRVVGSLVEYLFAPDDPEAVLRRLVDPATRIVSLTITEGGYHVNQVTGEFDADDPHIQADLRPGALPSTTFGFVTEALARRRDAGTDPFVVMSCDNIQGNGEVAHKMIGAFARLKDPGLADWLEEHVVFPNSMVDRITPVTTDADRALLAEQFDVQDGWPVVCEPFTQWVLEDRFPHGRPPWEEVGVQVVPDVEPYELMKLRLLNASHQAMCYLGYLSGYRYAHEVCADPLFTAVPARLHGRGGDAVPGAGAGGGPRRVQASSSSGSPTPRSATPSPGCARRARTGSRSGCCRWCVTTSRPAARSAARRSWSPAGRATPRASTRRASRSTWSTGAATR